MIEINCPTCRAENRLDAAGVILGRRFPSGEGSLAYFCRGCGTPVAMTLSCDAVMFAVFAGAEPIDEESFDRPEHEQSTE